MCVKLQDCQIFGLKLNEKYRYFYPLEVVGRETILMGENCNKF